MTKRRDWSIHEIAKLVGTTTRTLRHYDEIGLLRPSRVGSNHYRYYDQQCLVRLQRILLLRDMGLGLDAIANVLSAQESDIPRALEAHLAWLKAEAQRLSRQIATVSSTIEKLQKGEPLMAEEVLDGFEHTRYKQEVEQRWGKEAYAQSDRWYRSLTPEEKQAFKDEAQAISSAFANARKSGLPPESAEVQAITRRHFEWLRQIPGTPGGQSTGPTREYFLGLAEMYVADARFTQNYDKQAPGTAELVRDAMRYFAEQHLSPNGDRD